MKPSFGNTLPRSATDSKAAVGHRLVEALRAVVRGLRTNRRRRQAVRELSRMPDRTLEDLGISRDRIREIVDEMVTRPEPRDRVAGTARGIPAAPALLTRCQTC